MIGARSAITGSSRKRAATPVLITNLPPQPGSVAYGPSTTALSLLSNYARPGGMVISSRGNFNDQVYHDISTAGGHHLMYLDPIVWNTIGRYHDLMFNSSALGAAVPKWPGPISANGTGDLADFRVGGVLQSKFQSVLELMVAENPHMCGWFFDDIGSRSYFPNFDWATFGSTNQSDYRAGAIALLQTARTVADANGLFFMVNGTWNSGTLAATGGGYPTLTTHGCSLAEGGVVEHHDTEIAYWGPYMGEATSQWGEASPVSNGKPLCFAIMNTSAGVTEFRNDGRAAWVSQQTTDEYNGVVPWGTSSDFHSIGLPSSTRPSYLNPAPVSASAAAAGSAGSATSMTWTCPPPANLVEGNLLIAFSYVATSSTVTLSPPAGWTTVGSFGAASTAGWMHVSYKYVTSGEVASPPANYSFSGTSGSATGWYPSASIIQYSGAASSSPIDVTASTNSATTSTSHVAPSVTTTATQTRLISAFGGFNPDPIVNWDIGMLPRSSAYSSGNEGLYIFDQSRTSSGATGTRTALSANADRTCAVTVAIK